jgi:hypothetical protein
MYVPELENVTIPKKMATVVQRAAISTPDMAKSVRFSDSFTAKQKNLQ